nr:hypothetical protein [Burkholderia multivorans]
MHVESDVAYTYGSFSDLEKNFDKSVEGIKSCEKSIAELIGQDLARTPTTPASAPVAAATTMMTTSTTAAAAPK